MKILGVSPFHDSSAAALDNGVLKHYFREERLSGRKHDAQPFKAVEAILSLGFRPDVCVVASPDQLDPTLNVWQQYLGKVTGCREVIDMSNQHHLQHAHLAYVNGGWDECLVVVIDRVGSRACGSLREGESIFHFKEGKSQSIYKNYWSENHPPAEQWKEFCDLNKHVEMNWSDLSICRLYEAATTVIDQHPLEAGKAMGLSAYGDMTAPLFDREGLFPVSDPIEDITRWGETVAKWRTLHVEKNITFDNHKPYADVAHAIQREVENAVLKQIERFVHETGVKRVCVTGGFAYNVVANGMWKSRRPDIQFYFEPNADDGGNSIGAAMCIHQNETGRRPQPLKNTFYHGITYDVDVEGAYDITIKDIAKALHEGKVVGVYQGLSEAGPRALGNRSILANPMLHTTFDRVNDIKKREWYRPYAGCVIKERAGEYFKVPRNFESSAMTESYNVLTDQLPAITHKDNSSRIQTVDKEDIILYSILAEFEKLSGIPVLLNTSMNGPGKPLVEDPDQAKELFTGSSLDILYFPKQSKALIK